jgi:hypothetical protein
MNLSSSPEWAGPKADVSQREVLVHYASAALGNADPGAVRHFSGGMG